MPIGMFGHGETVTLRRRAPAVDSGGDRIYDDYGAIVYTDTTQQIVAVATYPESATEVGQGNERTNTVYVMVIPDGIAVDAKDYVTWRGKNYEVQGEAERHSSPMTGTAHQMFRVARVEG